MFVVTVEFQIVVDNAEAFRAAVLQQAANSMAKEEKCRQFDVCFAADNPALVFLYEIYDDARSFDLHLATDHFLSFDQQVRPWVTDKTVKCWVRS